MTENRKGDWCQTFTGRAIYPIDMRAEDVDLKDIAHSLALQCRFTGHCLDFYSVADHSLRVCEQVQLQADDLDLLRWALLHDAAEAYMKDIPRPVKRSIDGWQAIELQIEAAIAERFGLSFFAEERIPSVVRHADSVLLATEARDLMAPPPQAWEHLPPPLTVRIVPLHWQVAEYMFLGKARELGLS